MALSIIKQIYGTGAEDLRDLAAVKNARHP